MSDTNPTLAQLAPQMYKALTDVITFSKRQQWAITNYTVLAYAGLVGLAKSFDVTSTCEQAIMTGLALLAGSGSIALLGKIQCDIGGYREQLEGIHSKFLTEDQFQAMGIEHYEPPYWRRGVDFVAALMVVVAIGGVLAVWSLWR